MTTAGAPLKSNRPFSSAGRINYFVKVTLVEDPTFPALS